MQASDAGSRTALQTKLRVYAIGSSAGVNCHTVAR